MDQIVSGRADERFRQRAIMADTAITYRRLNANTSLTSKLVKMGADGPGLVSACGLSAAEVGLSRLMHRKMRKPVRSATRSLAFSVSAGELLSFFDPFSPRDALARRELCLQDLGYTRASFFEPATPCVSHQATSPRRVYARFTRRQPHRHSASAARAGPVLRTR